MHAEDAWRPMRASDIDAIEEVAAVVHATTPESPDVLLERLRLFPEGCFMTEGGYAIAHPVRRDRLPPLDFYMGRLPAEADSLHIHDVAMLPHTRGRRLGEAVMRRFATIVRQQRLRHMTLVSVYGSHTYWARHGFAEDPQLDSVAIRSYGVAAVGMSRTCPLG